MTTLIYGGRIVNECRTFNGSVIIDGGVIADIVEGNSHPRGNYQYMVDATGCFVLPGIIDDHVHFREPGLTNKADIESESRAAAYGGVTSYLEMPNTVPQTTTIEALEQKWQLGAAKSHVNYGFFFGATNDNAPLFQSLDRTLIPGIKLFMGSSTGNMLVDRKEALDSVFGEAARLHLPVMAHCEDTDIINRNMRAAKAALGGDPDISQHPLIRSAEACYASSEKAVELARKHDARLHIAHLSTARELQLLDNPTAGQMPQITGEAVLAHLLFDERDYTSLGALIKCNPAVKTAADKEALRQAVRDGRIYTVGTDHAPHLLEEKQGGAAKAKSGMPMIQFSLVSMLELVDKGVLSMERLVELMCHHPARLFAIDRRGYLRRGYHADITIVKPHKRWTVTKRVIQSKCKWSPLEGHVFNWRVEHTYCNGLHIYNKGIFAPDCKGEQLKFNNR
ncbi:MAG: dihydroorotase [Prevotella sp.]|jgi:dihydroorotase